MWVVSARHDLISHRVSFWIALWVVTFWYKSISEFFVSRLSMLTRASYPFRFHSSPNQVVIWSIPSFSTHLRAIQLYTTKCQATPQLKNTVGPPSHARSKPSSNNQKDPDHLQRSPSQTSYSPIRRSRKRYTSMRKKNYPLKHTTTLCECSIMVS